MRQVKGFTLIELIVVIVILGILAVTAAPKFIDLQSDARKATLNGVKGSIRSAVTLIRGKAIIQGLDKTASGKTIDVGGGSTVALVYGYPDATNDGIGNALDMTLNTQLDSKTSECADEWCYFTETAGDYKYFYIIPQSKTISCSVSYKISTTTDKDSEIDITDSNC